MRVIVTGDRHWYSPDLAGRVLGRLAARYGDALVIVEGGASGVDESFRLACHGLGIAFETHPARWDELGRRAGPLRNAEMVAAGAGLCLAFHRFLAGSKGTRDCCLQAVEAGIPTYLIDREDGEPRRLRAGDPRLE
jgi:hypothetical protein